MVADETCMRLIDLQKYEASRAAPIADEVYRANANLLMHDEPVYRCERKPLCSSLAFAAVLVSHLHLLHSVFLPETLAIVLQTD
jgi:hypothetical protein